MGVYHHGSFRGISGRGRPFVLVAQLKQPSDKPTARTTGQKIFDKKRPHLLSVWDWETSFDNSVNRKNIRLSAPKEMVSKDLPDFWIFCVSLPNYLFGSLDMILEPFNLFLEYTCLASFPQVCNQANLSCEPADAYTGQKIFVFMNLCLP